MAHISFCLITEVLLFLESNFFLSFPELKCIYILCFIYVESNLYIAKFWIIDNRVGWSERSLAIVPVARVVALDEYVVSQMHLKQLLVPKKKILGI